MMDARFTCYANKVPEPCGDEYDRYKGWLNEHYSSNSTKNVDEQDPSNYSSKNTSNYSELLGFRSCYLTDGMYERIET